ncbi:MAG: hypothetical protein V7K25_14755 [Nostoc sp.]|uniref:hypothetical protein n=1 Tax=Nostoc sp. TaxID=1180 RepID=UPI002FFA024A
MFGAGRRIQEVRNRLAKLSNNASHDKSILGLKNIDEINDINDVFCKDATWIKTDFGHASFADFVRRSLSSLPRHTALYFYLIFAAIAVP